MKMSCKNTCLAVGVMSGTSVDGLDMALCGFDRRVKPAGNTESGRLYRTDSSRIDKSHWNFKILKAETFSYSGTSWPERLAEAETANGYALAEVHRDFGRFIGKAVKDFLTEAKPAANPPDDPAAAGNYSTDSSEDDTSNPEQPIPVPSPGNIRNTSLYLTKPDLIASHGHTIFHRPEKGVTLQIGDGAGIAAVTGVTTVSDFRRLDVALGGQGAPLVPIGDELLFGEYGYCLNLGGFANISFCESGKRVAFDICPANMGLNRLARHLGKDFDKGGGLAAAGKVDRELLEGLENLEFYRTGGPRSLGKEWVDEVFMPVIEGSGATIEDKLRTLCEHIALRIAGVMTVKPSHQDITDRDITGEKEFSMLVTGGGAKNNFLMRLISEKAGEVNTVIPDEKLIDFKEAVVFAFLGLLRIRNEVNCLASVTGAERDNCGGIVHLA